MARLKGHRKAARSLEGLSCVVKTQGSEASRELVFDQLWFRHMIELKLNNKENLSFIGKMTVQQSVRKTI